MHATGGSNADAKIRADLAHAAMSWEMGLDTAPALTAFIR